MIRPERPADHAAIDGVVRGAFARHPDEVALLVERIRASAGFEPGLALLAEDASGVVAHVLLSWIPLRSPRADRILNLSPMSVRPDRQRRGVGRALIVEALARAEAQGAPAVVVEGIPAYYPQFGFEPASPLGFVAAHPSIPDEAFMVKRLGGFTPELAGPVSYPEAFDHLAY